jgi:site-specific DNA-cytosine methylase
MNYYNEFDPKAADWLRELIRQKLIPEGIVDQRSITEINPDELTQYIQCHFFAGVAGWSLALELAGWPPDRPVWTGSCPCQPFSSAGQGKGGSDDRHLWPAFFDLIRQCRPPIVFGEQVASALVVGKRTSPEDVREVLDRKIVNRILREQIGNIQDAMQGLRKQENEGDTESQLRGSQNIEARDDSGICRQVSGKEVQDTVRFGCKGHSEQNNQWNLRTDRDSVRVEDTKSMEQPITGSDSSRSWLHEKQCQGGSLFGECDESQLGAESDFEDFGFDQGAAEAEIERLIRETGGEPEETATVWIDGIQDDLEEIGYAFGACVMAASSVGSPHIRQRLFWVADANSGRCQQRDANERSLPIAATDGATGGVGDAKRERLEGLAWNGGNGNQSGRIDENQAGYATAPSKSLRLADPDDSGLQGREWDRQTGQEKPSVGHATECGGNLPTAWSRFEIVHCRDGKARRFEPESHPLVNGFPSRVAVLRGFGNAIVPQVAAEFILASE